MKKIFKFFILCFLFIILFLFVAEVLTRIIFKERFRDKPTHIIYDPDLGYKNRPNLSEMYFQPERNGKIGYSMHITTDKNGFRVNSFVPKVYDKEILFLGDSYGFGWGVDDDQTLCAYLQKLLRDYNIKVINTSVEGYGTVQYRIQLEKYLKLNHKKIIAIIILHCSNDFTNNIAYYYWKNGFDKRWAPDTYGLRNKINYIFKRFHFYNYLHFKFFFLKLKLDELKNKILIKIKSYNNQKKSNNTKREMHSVPVIKAGDIGLKITELKKEDILGNSSPSELKKYHIDILKYETTKIFNITEKNNIPVIMSYVNFENHNKIFKSLMDLCSEKKLCYYFDLKEIFPEGYGDKDFNKHSGGHWSAQGNQKIANYFFNKLKDIFNLNSVSG